MRIARIVPVAAVVAGALSAAGVAATSSYAPRQVAAGAPNGFQTTAAQDARVLKDTLAWVAQSKVKAKKK